MLTEQEFSELLQRNEDETLDFKQEGYDLSREDKKFALVKDVLCMANTPRDESSYILLGVKKYPDGKFDLIGLDSHEDEANLQSQFSGRVYPVPRFSYEPVSYQGRAFGVIVIPPDRIGPCEPLRDSPNGNFLRQHQIYFRRGSRNDIAGPEDTKRICKWIEQEYPRFDLHVDGPPDFADWERFVDAVHSFSTSRKYLLVTNTPDPGGNSQLEMLGAAPWSFVVDLDPASDQSGVLKVAGPRLKGRRNIHMVVRGDRPTLNLDRGTYWFFARGLEGSTQPPELGSWRNWQQKLGQRIA